MHRAHWRQGNGFISVSSVCPLFQDVRASGFGFVFSVASVRVASASDIGGIECRDLRTGALSVELPAVVGALDVIAHTDAVGEGDVAVGASIEQCVSSALGVTKEHEGGIPKLHATWGCSELF